MDMQKFKSPSARGDFSDNPDGYAAWSAWATRIRNEIGLQDRRHAHLSSGVPLRHVLPIVVLCAENPESAFHVLVQDMVHCGASWLHLDILRRLAVREDVPFPDMEDINGYLVPQLARTLTWYDGLTREPEAVIVDAPRRCVGRSIWGNVDGNGHCIEFEATPDGGARVFMNTQGKGAAIHLPRKDVENLVEAVIEEASQDHDSNRESIFIGSEGTGLLIARSFVEGPYRPTFDISMVSAGKAVTRTFEIETYRAADLMVKVSLMLDIQSRPTVEVPARSGRR